jgi:hypothetical protein
VFSIVLTLAVGQDATLLCRVWCNPQAAAASGCHHEESINPPTVAGDSCDYVLGVGAFIREEAGRTVAAPDVAHAIVVPRYQIAQLTADARPDWEPGREWWLAKRPLSTALRI